MRTEIKLHGKLAKLFPEKVYFNGIRKPLDVTKALSTRFKSFKKTVMDLENQGIHFQILINENPIETEFQFKKQAKINQVDIVPCIMGSGPVAAVAAIFGGGILMGGSIVLFGSAAFTFTLGLGLVLAGVTYLMSAPADITPQDQEASIQGESYYFATQSNTAAQGSAVPISYGLMRVGSKVVQNALRQFDKDSYEKKAPYDTSLQVKQNGKRGIVEYGIIGLTQGIIAAELNALRNERERTGKNIVLIY